MATDVLIFLSSKEIKDGLLRFSFQLSSFIVFHGAADAGTNSMKCYTDSKDSKMQDSLQIELAVWMEASG